jgi:hypothetical protein
LDSGKELPKRVDRGCVPEFWESLLVHIAWCFPSPPYYMSHAAVELAYAVVLREAALPWEAWPIHVVEVRVAVDDGSCGGPHSFHVSVYLQAVFCCQGNSSRH